LHEIGEPAVEPMIAAMQRSSGGRKAQIIFALGEFDDRRCVGAIAQALADPESSVRYEAARSIQRTLCSHPALGKTPGVVPSLVRALADADADIRRFLIEALGHCRDPRAVEPLLKMLADPDGNVRWDAIRSLGEIGDRRAEARLLEIMRDRMIDVSERGVAASSLGKLGNPAMIRILLKTIDDPNSATELRCGALRGLGFTHDQSALAVLCRFLYNHYEPLDTRVAAVRGIADIGDGEAIDTLCRLVADKYESWPVRARAGLSLVDITNGAVDDVMVVQAVASGDPDDDELIDEYRLKSIVANGRTSSVRAAARRALRINSILGLDERTFYLVLTAIYYALVICVLRFRLRKKPTRGHFTARWIVVAAALVVIGLPLALATWYAW
jgi:HEAT repeat protein